MSMYCSVQTQFKDQEALITALTESRNTLGKLFSLQDIEIHDIPTNLYGYRGDIRKEKANIIIRRRNVGGAANDVGFVKNENGEFTAIISEYDKTHYNEQWLNNLKANYAYHIIRARQEKMGRIVSRERLTNGKQKIIIKGYR